MNEETYKYKLKEKFRLWSLLCFMYVNRNSATSYRVLNKRYGCSRNTLKNGFGDLEGIFCYNITFTEINGPDGGYMLTIQDSEAYNAEEIIKAKRENRPPILIPHFSCHHIRHTFCTRFCENETNLKVIQSVMGHKDIQTTMDIYAEATESKKKEAIQALENLDSIF